ncbi:MAG: hypothetical protein K2L51_07345 [Clostridiales bacterium]|nr:hypothetical protein [Clostridiales bacterium]
MARRINLFRLLYAAAEAREIRGDAERRQRSKKFGIHSIVNALFAVPFGALTAVFPQWMRNSDTQLLFIFGVAIFIIGIAGMLILLVNAIAYFLLQLSLNRTAVTWVALVFLILSVAGCALVSLWAFGLF